jgi:hypothetical protein
VTGKELKCLGIALKALMKHKMYDVVEDVIDVMAEDEKGKEEKREQKE